MSKKFIIAAILAAAVALAGIAACQKTNYELISDAFGNINDAISAEKLVEVTNGGTLLASVEEEYEVGDSGYLVTTTTVTLNKIGQGDGMYSTEVEGPVSCSSINVGDFPAESMLSGAVYDGEEQSLSLSANLAAEYLVSLGMDADAYTGEVDFTASLSSGKFAEMEISYASSNGNDVSIKFVFEYR